MMDRDKSHLFAPFAGLLAEFELELFNQGLPFYLFEGFRSWDRQDLLYAQGRTTPGKIVTKARAGRSWHNYGLAADYVLDGVVEKPGIQWSWELKADLNADDRNDWLQMAEIAVAHGLEAAWFWATFPEAPHVQATYGMTLTEAYQIHQAGGIEAVWQKAQDWLERQLWP
jgi:hypothetical protein